MNIASLNSRMLMQASSCDGTTIFNHKKNLIHPILSFFNSKFTSVSRVSTLSTSSTLTEAHRTFNVRHWIKRCVSPCVQPNFASRNTFITSTISPGRLMHGVHTCPTGYESANIWRTFRSLEVDKLESLS